MFIADDVLCFPFKSILWVFREIYNAAVEEMASESDAIRTELSQLYLALEAGTISEDAFDTRERELLDRLDTIEQRGPIEEDDVEDEDAADQNESQDEEPDEWDDPDT
jgi:hypothetical protein